MGEGLKRAFAAAKATRAPLETREQEALFTWASVHERKYPALACLYAVPNGANKSFAQAAKFKREGLKAGVPDVVLPVARGGYHALYIEMKRRRIMGKRVLLAGESPSPQQLMWHERLRAEGNKVVTCYGWDEAVKELLVYLTTDDDSGVRPVPRE